LCANQAKAMIKVESATEETREPLRRRERTFRAPGRVNLIGEHTDYNDGFVMPAAIGFSTFVTVKPRDDRKLLVYSENFSEEVEFDLDEANPQARGHWSDYVHGVAVVLQQAGYTLSGATLRIRGKVPIGSGLSSSAAIEVATGLALMTNAGLDIDRVTLARLCQRAENEFVRLRCGIMDQFISCVGQAGKALLLDCRSLEFRLLPVPETVRLVICNTMVRHEHASGEYNARRAECLTGVEVLARNLSHVRALRDVSEVQLEENKHNLTDNVYRRCRHVISENARVLAAAGVLEQHDFEQFGELMNKSHFSLRDDYEVSCAELDLMAEVARTVPGVYGARMTGGGFGGCTVNLVTAEAVEQFQQVVNQGYFEATGITPKIYVCQAASGAEEI
jgi:galactokinase